MRTIVLASLLVVVAVLTACGVAVPADKSAYVGRWLGPNMSLQIQQDGRVDYKRTNGNSSSSISAPLQAFHGDNFDVGLGPVTTTFKVSAPPHQENGQTRMTVDGVDLVKMP